MPKRALASRAPYMSSDCQPPSTEGPPGSCQSCRQRKLKCDRDTNGCFNCRKTESVCYYPTSNRRTKHKRGPYRKAQGERQIELERAIRALEHKNEQLLKLFDVDTSRLKVDSARVPKEMSAPVFEAPDLPMAMTPDLGNLSRNDSFDLPLLQEQVRFLDMWGFSRPNFVSRCAWETSHTCRPRP